MDINKNHLNVSSLSANIKSVKSTTSNIFNHHIKQNIFLPEFGNMPKFTDEISVQNNHKHAYVSTDIDSYRNRKRNVLRNIDCATCNLLEERPPRDIIISTPSHNAAKANTTRAHKQSNEQNTSQTNKDSNDGPDEGNVSNNGGSEAASGGNRDSNNDDDKDNKNINKHDKNDDDDEEKEEKDEQEDEKQKENLKCSGPGSVILNPNAREWDKHECGTKMKTIPETRPFQESNSKFFDPVGPSKIEICRKLTEEVVPARVLESFYNVYHFMNKSLVFQCIKSIQNNICIINYGFHDKNTQESLYCLAEKVNESNDTKYKWKMMDQLFTSHQIQEEHNIAHSILPPPITSSPQYVAQIERFKAVTAETVLAILSKNNWQNIQVHTKRNYKERKTLFLSQSEFKKRIQQFRDIKFFPMVRINNKAHYWIEHVFIVPIQKNMTIAISLQYDVITTKIKVTGIHLNKQYLHKSHQLIAPHHSSCACLDSFESFYDDLVIGNMDLKKEILRLQSENKKLKRDHMEPRPADYYKTKYVEFKQFMEKVVDSSRDSDLVTEAIQLLQTTTPLVDDGIAAKIDTDEKCASQVSTPSQTEATQPQIMDTLKVPQVEPIAIPVTHLGVDTSDTTSLPNLLPLPTRSLPLSIASVEESKTTPIYSALPTILPTPLYSASSYTVPMAPIPIYSPYAPYPPYPPIMQCAFGLPPPQIYHTVNTVNLSTQMTHVMYSRSDTPLNLKPSLHKPLVRCTHFSPMHGVNSIFIDKSLTKHYVSDNNHKALFKNDANSLYYYIKHSISMQIMDGLARKYDERIAIAHCDLYSNSSGYKPQALYAIMEALPHGPSDKLKWKMVSLSSDSEIFQRYSLNITSNQLPRSSRERDAFRKCIESKEKERVMRKIRESIPYIKLRNKQQVKSKPRSNCNTGKQIIRVSEKYIKNYITQCAKNNNASSPVPIVKIKGNKHWIEWVVVCKVPQKHIHFGVSFRCTDSTPNEVDATSIFLDGSEIERQNKLISAMHSHDLSKFVSAISKLVITSK